MIFVKQNMISRGSNFYLLQKEAGCRYTFLYDLSILIISQVFLKLRNWDFYRLKVGSLFSCEHSCHQCLVFKKIQRFSCRLRVMLERNTNYTRTTILKSGQGNPYNGAGPGQTSISQLSFIMTKQVFQALNTCRTITSCS